VFDGEDQVVELDPARVPVMLVAGVTDVRVFLVALEHERPGADRLLVDVARLALGKQLVGVLGGENGGEAHGDVLDERGVDAVERHDHGQRPGFFDLGDVLVQAHPVEVRKFGRVSLAERLLRIEHAIEGEQHVVGVEIAGRGEVIGRVKFHPGTQVKGVLEAVLGNIPACGKARYDIGRAFFKLCQAVVQRFGGVVIGRGRVLRCIENQQGCLRSRTPGCYWRPGSWKWRPTGRCPAMRIKSRYGA
jgi:hypothetical protein